MLQWIPFLVHCFGTTDGSIRNKDKGTLCLQVVLFYCFINNSYWTAPQDVNDILLYDNDSDDLLKASGLNKRVAGMMMEAEADFKKKKTGDEAMKSNVKDLDATICCDRF